MHQTYVAIMAGGIGSRFWPLSRAARPKQFIDVLGTGKTLLQSTYERFLQLVPSECILVVTNADYVDLVHEQLPALAPHQVLAEPMRRNTAPCIAYAANAVARLDPDACMVVAPSDHLITNEAEFLEVLRRAVDHTAAHDDLVTLGIRPTRPDTGYGYIQYDEEDGIDGVYRVKTFTEKPNLELAKTFMRSGDFLWNSGIFVWRVLTVLEAFAHHLPEIGEAFRELRDHLAAPDAAEHTRKAFSLVTNISIDYGVMEKADNVRVIPASFGWSDLGTWVSLYEKHHRDYLGNAAHGQNVMIYDATNCMVRVPDNKLAVLQGLDDFIVVDTPDVLLICQKEKEQFIKEIASDVRRKKGERFL
jgi:mannose-1-phosphate guanylyltransferase